MITDDEIAKFTDKSSRDPEIVRLYRENDFLTAYGKHTDMRVAADPQHAIGGMWEEYGNLQRDFLIGQGLKPEHKLLDVGCGTGRLARKIVPYLDKARYVGLDCSYEARAYAEILALDEGWSNKSPRFTGPDMVFLQSNMFDFAWAFSVFIHLPNNEALVLISQVMRALSLGGKFFFSYVPTDLPNNTRTGVKQFKHPREFYQLIANKLGYSLSDVDWPGRQRILCMEKVNK